MAVKPFVFGSDDGVAKVRGNRVSGDRACELIAAPCELLAVHVEHGDGAPRAAIDQGLGARQFGRGIKDSDCDDQANDRSAAPENAPDQAKHEPKECTNEPQRPLLLARLLGRLFLRRRFRRRSLLGCSCVRIAILGNQRWAFASRSAHFLLFRYASGQF